MVTRKKNSKVKETPKTNNERSWFRKFAWFAMKAGFAALLAYCCFWGIVAWEKFGSKKWELPARVYARPLELYTGLSLDANALSRELSLLSYRKTNRIEVPGSYSVDKNVFTIYCRPFEFPDGQESAKKIRVEIQAGRVSALTEVDTGKNTSIARLDPALVGSFYPASEEDRLWVKLDDAPPILIQTIMAAEDREFYDHYGIKPLSILRALKANILAGKAVQGGSTLTQQLVKNLFLTREKTLVRKIEEAIMALSLELFYDKDKIFEAYINEVYLAQDGKRAIHGFGMASRFYFGRSLEHLQTEEIAFLVGLLKGPSYYNPRKHPARALERRNLILNLMAEQKLIQPAEAQRAKSTELGFISDPQSGFSPFPAFLELVQRSLLKDYDEQDLRTEGLRIFSTLVPRVQFAVEDGIEERLKNIEAARGLPVKTRQAAAVVTGAGNNEVAALAGGREGGEHGFNRALDSRRPIGSLIKPAVYLTALMQPERYTLITPLEDSPIRIETKSGIWEPKNYEGRFNGKTPLFQALANSCNAATVRLGMDVGIKNVFETIGKLGVDENFPAYPSALLGAVGLSSLELVQMYQTFAAGGFYTPVRAIQAVYRPDGSLLQRYPLTVRENVDPGAVYLLNKALQTVITEGTGKHLDRGLAGRLTPAGKTGTTDDLRDSWFAGFTGDHAAVVWVGRDDNAPCGLTGASGAMQVWGDIMKRIQTSPLRLAQPDNVVLASIDATAGWRTEVDCQGSLSIPFIAGSEPADFVSCRKVPPPEIVEESPPARKDGKENKSMPSRIKNFFKELF